MLTFDICQRLVETSIFHVFTFSSVYIRKCVGHTLKSPVRAQPIENCILVTFTQMCTGCIRLYMNKKTCLCASREIYKYWRIFLTVSSNVYYFNPEWISLNFKYFFIYANI